MTPFKRAVDVTVTNVKYLLSRGYDLEDAIEFSMCIVELLEWITDHVRKAVEDKFKEVKKA